MAIKVIVEDTSLDIVIIVQASGSYSPDVLDDLTTRASLLYRTGIGDKLAAMPQAAVVDDD